MVQSTRGPNMNEKDHPVEVGYPTKPNFQPLVNLRLAVKSLTTRDPNNPTKLFNSSLAFCLLLTGDIFVLG